MRFRDAVHSVRGARVSGLPQLTRRTPPQPDDFSATRLNVDVIAASDAEPHASALPGAIGDRGGWQARCRSIAAAPIRRLRALVAAPTRKVLAVLAGGRSRPIAELRGDVEHLLWLQTNHLEHLLEEIARDAWLNSNHANHELRLLREAVGASGQSAPSSENEDMLLALLIQVQSLAASLGTTESHVNTVLTEVSARLESLEAQVARLASR